MINKRTKAIIASGYKSPTKTVKRKPTKSILADLQLTKRESSILTLRRRETKR